MSQYLGDISAYALAVSQGYTGTEEEYAELMASYATVGQTAVTAAQTATTKASEAATSATTATTKASEATTAATTATNKAGEASTSASTATSAKDTAVSASQVATSKASEAAQSATSANTAKVDAVAAKTAAETAQGKAEDSANEIASSAAQIAQNTSDISELKSGLKDIDSIKGAEIKTVSRTNAFGVRFNSPNVQEINVVSHMTGDTAVAIVTAKKNCLVFPYPMLSGSAKSGTVNGINYVVNDDGSITLDGTATADAHIIMDNNIYIGTEYMSYNKRVANGFYLSGDYIGYIPNNKRIELSIPNGTILNNKTVYPQLEFGFKGTEWEKPSGEVHRVDFGTPTSGDYTWTVSASKGVNTIIAYRAKYLFDVEYDEKIMPVVSNRYMSDIISSNIISRYINGQNFVDHITHIKTMGVSPQPVKSHDSTLQIVNGVAHCVYTTNSVDTGDSASSDNAYVHYKSYNLTTHAEVDIDIAKNGDTFGTLNITGGCGSPNLFVIGSTTHILFCANVNDTFAIVHCNVNDGIASNYSIISIDNMFSTVKNLNDLFGLNYDGYNYAQINSKIASDGNGTYFAGLCVGGGDKSASCVLKTTDFVKWYRIYEYDFSIDPIFELACYYFNNYLYFAQRPIYKYSNVNENAVLGDCTQYGILGKIDPATGELIDYVSFQNCSSRPTFFVYDGNLYLVSNPKTRNDCDFIKVDELQLSNSIIIQQSNDVLMSYPSFDVYNGDIYMTRSFGNIQLSKIVVDEIDKASIKDAIMGLFT